MLSAFANCLKIPDLRQRIFFTLALTFICRLIDIVPTPGVNLEALQGVMKNASRAGGVLSWLDLFSGGALGNFAVGALAIWPYISASIILQMMTAIIPALERLAREGDVGRQKISQYTRYFTVVICIVQGLFLAINIERPGALGLSSDVHLVAYPGWGFRLTTVLVMTTGTMLLMWLGEQITERGIGNGISIVITINIVSRLPQSLATAWTMFSRVGEVESRFTIFDLVIMIALIFVVTMATIALTQGQRKIPIHRPQRVIGRKIAMGQSSYMPLRVNYSGVMPIIFAGAMIQFPVAILGSIKYPICQSIAAAFGREGWLFLMVYSAMILFFSYFWVATQFNPLQIADDLKKNGAYVPGIRPGRPTAEFLDKTMVRVTLFGALFLTVIAVIPSVLSGHFHIPWIVSQFFGGTSLLIIVGVALDTMRQVESHLLMRHYDGFLTKGKLRGRR